MPSLAIQCVFQALPDHNVPTQIHFFHHPMFQAFGRRVLAALPAHGSYWLLLRHHQLPGTPRPGTTPLTPAPTALDAVYLADAQRAERIYPALENLDLQSSAERCLRLLSSCADRRNDPPYIFWLYVSLAPQQGEPPLLPPPRGDVRPAPVDISKLPSDDFLRKMEVRLSSERLQDVLPEIQAELKKRLDLVLELSGGPSSSAACLIVDDFYRGVARDIGSSFSYELCERLNLSPKTPQPESPKPESVVPLLQAPQGFVVEAGSSLRALLELQGQLPEVYQELETYCLLRWGFSVQVSVCVEGTPLDEPWQFRFSHRQHLLAQGAALEGRSLARGSAAVLERYFGGGQPHPLSGQPCAWVDEEQAEIARKVGCSLIAPCELASDLARLAIYQQPQHFFTTQVAADLLSGLTVTHPALVAECKRLGLTPYLLRRLVQELLRQRIGIHDHVGLLEAALDGLFEQPGMGVEKLDLWVGKVRTLLQRTVQRVHLQPNGALPTVRLGDSLDPDTLLSRLAQGLKAWPHHPAQPVLLVSADQQAAVESLVRPHFAWLAVLSESEVLPGTPLSPGYTLAELCASGSHPYPSVA